MMRFADVIQVPADRYDEYVEKHEHIWPQIVEKMHAAHIENFSIFYRDGYLFKYYEYSGNNYEADMKRLENDEENQRWLEFTAVCQRPVSTAEKHEWWAPMKLIFHL